MYAALLDRKFNMSILNYSYALVYIRNYLSLSHLHIITPMTDIYITNSNLFTVNISVDFLYKYTKFNDW